MNHRTWNGIWALAALLMIGFQPSAALAQDGACCLNGGVCSSTSQLVCEIFGGQWQGAGTDCADIVCEDNCGGGCSPNEVYDCLGHCFPVSWIGDGTCDDGDYQWDTVNIYLNCEEFGWDGGDCPPPPHVPEAIGACRVESLTDCDGACYCEAMSLEDCIALGNGTYLGAGTTCLDSTCDCPPGLIPDCAGNCFELHMIGNGLCQDGEYYNPPGDGNGFWLDLSCLELACDGGDCTGSCSGACCFGDSCSDGVSMIDCYDNGGVFLGPARECFTVDCNDFLVPLTLSQPLEAGDSNPERSPSSQVSSAGGITASPMEQPDGQPVLLNIYDGNNLSPTVTLETQLPSADTPLVDTDGVHIAVSINNWVAIYETQGGNWVEQSLLQISGMTSIDHLAIENGRLFTCSGNQVQIREWNNSQWSLIQTLTGLTGPINSIDVSENSFAIGSQHVAQIFEYPFNPNGYVRVDLFGTSGDTAVAIDGNLLVISEGAGYAYGWWDADIPAQVYLHQRSAPGANYSLQDTLVALDSKSDDMYGHHVDVDGETVLVTAPGHDGQSANAGTVFVFREVDNNWKQIGKIYPQNAVESMGFGRTASLDGNRVSIGWERLDSNGDATLTGAQTCELASHEWANVEGGNIASSNNWLPSLPDAGSSARISIPKQLPITVNGSIPFDHLVVGPSRPELDLQFQDATIGQPGQTGSGSVQILGSQTYIGSLGVDNGTLKIEGDAQIGSSPYRPGGLKLGGAGSVRVEGDYTQSKLGELAVVLQDRPDSALVVNGDISIQGTLSASCPGYNTDPEVGSSWSIIRSDSGINPEQDRFQMAILPGVGNDKYVKVNYSTRTRGAVSIFLTVESISGLFDVESSSNVSIEGMATDLVVADLGSPDGPPDGFDDIALTIGGDPGYVYIFINDGMGNIASQVTYTAGHNPSSLNAADFDQDGNIDLVVTNADDDNVFMILNDGGSIDAMTVQAATSTGDNPVDVAVLDIDLDEDMDIAVSCAGSGEVLPDGTMYGQIDFFEAFPGTRSVFSQKGSVGTGDTPGPIDPGELGNSKGGRKLVVTLRSGNSAMTLGQTLDGGFDWEVEDTNPVGTDPNSLAIGDLNNDGIDDAVIGNHDSGTLSIMLGDGSGSLIPEATFPVGANPESITLLDYDGDLDLDMAVIADVEVDEPAVLLYRNDSSLNISCGVTFSLEQTLEQGNQPILVGNGLLDDDSADDLVAITRGTLFRRGDDPDGMSMALMSAPVGGGGSCFNLGDINFDNIIDINDILELLSFWGTQYNDINGDDIVNVDDLLIVINNWGPCPRN